jgi:hypothetical protein
MCDSGTTSVYCTHRRSDAQADKQADSKRVTKYQLVKDNSKCSDEIEAAEIAVDARTVLAMHSSEGIPQEERTDYDDGLLSHDA